MCVLFDGHSVLGEDEGNRRRWVVRVKKVLARFSSCFGMMPLVLAKNSPFRQRTRKRDVSFLANARLAYRFRAILPHRFLPLILILCLLFMVPCTTWTILSMIVYENSCCGWAGFAGSNNVLTTYAHTRVLGCVRERGWTVNRQSTRADPSKWRQNRMWRS